MGKDELEDPMKVDGIGHYERLGITQQADDKEIKKAYRNRARELHPDKNKDDPDAGDALLAFDGVEPALTLVLSSE